MLNFGAIAGFDWDAGNERKSADKHGVSQKEAEEAFFNAPLLAMPDPSHSKGESRFHLLGVTNESRTLHITFTLRAHDTLIRVISAREMSQKERLIYEKAP
jgi:uncharacterized protein